MFHTMINLCRYLSHNFLKLKKTLYLQWKKMLVWGGNYENDFSSSGYLILVHMVYICIFYQ